MGHFDAFEKHIGISFRNKILLNEAMTHRSYLNEDRSWFVPHNERLEFLGDAVIELAMRNHLLKIFPKKTEGELTQIRGVLGNTKTFAAVAEELWIPKFVLMSQGQKTTRDNYALERIFGSAYEAFVGALFLDQGFGSAQMFVKDTLLPRLIDILAENAQHDPKSLFQEEAQAILSTTPTYKVLEERGPAHGKIFVVGVFLGPDLVAEGEGGSKKDAEVTAAKKALEARGWGMVARERRAAETRFNKLIKKTGRHQ